MLPYFRVGPLIFHSFTIAFYTSFLASTCFFIYSWRSRHNSNLILKPLIAFLAASGCGLGGVVIWQGYRSLVFSSLPIGGPLLGVGGSRWIFTGMIAAFVGGSVALKLMRTRVFVGLDSLSLSVAVGHFIHRIGCFLAGDGCYGPPTELPWGIAFEHGSEPTTATVHPTMLYEAILMIIIFTSLLWQRKRLPNGGTFAVFLVLAGLGCFFTQFLLPDPILAIGLTEAQLVSLIVVVPSGILLFAKRWRTAPT